MSRYKFYFTYLLTYLFKINDKRSNRNIRTYSFFVDPDHESGRFELVSETQHCRFGAVIVTDEDVLGTAASAATYTLSSTCQFTE